MLGEAAEEEHISYYWKVISADQSRVNAYRDFYKELDFNNSSDEVEGEMDYRVWYREGGAHFRVLYVYVEDDAVFVSRPSSQEKAKKLSYEKLMELERIYANEIF